MADIKGCKMLHLTGGRSNHMNCHRCYKGKTENSQKYYAFKPHGLYFVEN
jgi:hypothetical protein